MLPIGGCQLGDRLATFQAADARLDVSLPTVCDAFLQPVPVAPVTRKTNARVAYTRAADERDEANARLAGGRDCRADERAGLSTKEQPK